jgi:hypothetical protein
MSGFLSSLAARSFGLETGIRPRLASLFELARGASSALYAAQAFAPAVTETAAETEAFAEGMHEQIPSRDAHHPMHGVRGVRDAGAVSFEDPTRELGEIEADARRERGSRVAARPIPRETNLVSRSNEGENLLIPISRYPAAPAVAKRSSAPAGEARTQDGIAQTESSEFAPAASPMAQPGASAEEVRPAQRNGVPDRANANAQPAASNSNFETSESHSLVTPASTFAGLLEQMRNAASAMNAAAAAPAKGRATGSAAATDSAPESSVHVTIGRIEVRAVAENKGVSPARSASPVMGLEEYLHLRAQRGGK